MNLGVEFPGLEPGNLINQTIDCNISQAPESAWGLTW